MEALQKYITEGLHRLHDSGVGSKSLAMAVTNALFDFIANEAGAFTPQAIEEITDRLQELLSEAV
jgi:hypothetical protein